MVLLVPVDGAEPVFYAFGGDRIREVNRDWYVLTFISGELYIDHWLHRFDQGRGGDREFSDIGIDEGAEDQLLDGDDSVGSFRVSDLIGEGYAGLARLGIGGPAGEAVAFFLHQSE